MTLEELKVVITAETKELSKSVDNVKKELNSISSSVDKMGKNVQKSVSKASKSFDTLSTKIKGVFKGLLSSAGLLLGIAGLLRLGKTALSVASDLEEVQNVVDVSFGAMAADIDKFAKSALYSFGMSEVAAKRTASTFMAMSNGMDIAADSGKEMAVQLTRLTGDMASFFNTTQETAGNALEGIYTGNAQALKKFGIVMTEANLSAFALSRGIRKSYNEMSQAEKVALRYNYVMAATANVQGDFARTSNSWANQVRILKEQWTQLLGVLGTVLKGVILPLVQAMNQLLASAISVANALAKAFGFNGIKSASASVQSTAAGASDLSDSLGDANGSATKLQKTLASFDELNVLNDKSSGSGGGGGLAGLGGGVTADTVGISETVDEETQYSTSRIKAFIDECKGILNRWKDTIPKLEFKFDKEQALKDLEGIGLNIVNTIAGWGSFVISIAVKVANDLDIGRLLNDVLKLVHSFSDLVSAITDAVVPALQTLYDKAISPLVKWLGTTLSDAIQFVQDKFDAWAQWFRDNKEQIQIFAENLGEVLEPLTQIVIAIGDVAWSVFKDILEAINVALQAIADIIINLDLSQLTFLRNIMLALVGIKFLDLIIGFKGLWTAIESGYGIFPYLADLIKAPFQLLFGFLITATKNIGLFFSTLLTELGVAFGAIKTAVLTALTAIKTAVSSAISFLIANPIALIIAAIIALVALIAIKGDEIQKLLDKLDKWLQNIFARDWAEVFGPVLGNILNGFLYTVKTIWDGLKKNLDGWINFIRGVFTGDWSRAWNGLKEIVSGAFQGMIAVAKSPLNIIIGFVNGVIGGLNKIKLPNWDILGGLAGKGITLPKIPYLANGGVITSPTLAWMGEYSNAASNPEIVAPKDMLEGIMAKSNDDLITTLIQLNRQLISVIENKDTTVQIGDDAIANSIIRSNQGSIKRTGKPLLSY